MLDGNHSSELLVPLVRRQQQSSTSSCARREHLRSHNCHPSRPKEAGQSAAESPEACRVQVLVFSTSVRMLNVVEVLVIHLGYSYKRLDGSTPNHERQRACNDFNTHPATTVFLLSTMAGGLGINLQGANK